MRRLGLYLHIPFCRSKCLYCDFYSMPRPRTELLDAYTEALCRDAAAWGKNCDGYTVDTVYFGGGTPTVLSTRQLTRILETVAASFHLAPDAELTVECNPVTGARETFAELRRAGWNRLSIGVQSVHGNELRALGRLHDFSDVCRTWEDAMASGFSNLSADLMSGIPHQTVESWLATIEAVAALSPRHISAYGLIVEEGTPFSRMEARLPLPDEECARTMYFEGIRALSSNGFLQYEISNFAKPGYESRHNLKYWNCEEYLGLGPAAYSDLGGVRFGNARDVAGYLAGKNITAEREAPSAHDRREEYVMLRLRLTEGVDLADFKARFGASFAEAFGRRLERYIPMGLAEKSSTSYRLTPEGMYVSNAILAELLDFDANR